MTDESRKAQEIEDIREFCKELERIWIKHPSWTLNWLLVMTGIMNKATVHSMVETLKEKW